MTFKAYIWGCVIALVIGSGNAGACQPGTPDWTPEDFARADIIVVGHLTGYEQKLDETEQAEWRTRLLEKPIDKRLRAVLTQSPNYLKSIGRFAFSVEEKLKGDVPDRIEVAWDGLFGPPERVDDGRYMIALRPSRPSADTSLRDAGLYFMVHPSCLSPYSVTYPGKTADAIRKAIATGRAASE